jgi:hypothetical protein
MKHDDPTYELTLVTLSASPTKERDMWLEAWLAETLIRERIAEARRTAAVQRLLRQHAPAPPRRSCALRQLARTTALPRLKRLIERRAAS